MFTSFLDAALPDPVIEESSILPILIIVAVVVAAAILVRYEIKRSRDKKQGQNAQNNTDTNANKTDDPGSAGSKTDR
ncbi:MAG: hypothetical protein J6Y89_05205 [Lachnospiraceae bacterium]|nr:hypothetical protein [Lachnospiraceae bacterium]